MSVDPPSSSFIQTSSDMQFILDQMRDYIRGSTNLTKHSLTDQLYYTTQLVAYLYVPLDPSLHVQLFSVHVALTQMCMGFCTLMALTPLLLVVVLGPPLLLLHPMLLIIGGMVGMRPSKVYFDAIWGFDVVIYFLSNYVRSLKACMVLCNTKN
ncbi:uncharacterized protein M6B38_360190 [Iris pallida]|uniref:Uncharacterized protein n=1 Tax=Iris pallida TaxID=29817 RepID=A0AAX6GKE3_IRIPA|nr:uncharacterized protein M6B38_360190 [Iris pallida]